MVWNSLWMPWPQYVRTTLSPNLTGRTTGGLRGGEAPTRVSSLSISICCSGEQQPFDQCKAQKTTETASKECSGFRVDIVQWWNPVYMERQVAWNVKPKLLRDSGRSSFREKEENISPPVGEMRTPGRTQVSGNPISCINKPLLEPRSNLETNPSLNLAACVTRQLPQYTEFRMENAI